MQYLVFDANLKQRWRRVKEFVNSCTDTSFWIDIKHHTRCLLKDILELVMQDELAKYMHRQNYQRTENRIDYRNGYYKRSLYTELSPFWLILRLLNACIRDC